MIFQPYKKEKLATKKIVLSLGLFLSLTLTFFLLTPKFCQASDFSPYLPAPTVLEPQANATLSQDISIKGKTILPTKALIYLDGKKLGYASNISEENGYGNFVFNLSQEQILGHHELAVVAEYFNSYHSATTTLSFEILAQAKAPTVLTPVVNQETNFQQPWIVGLTPNDTQVEIYINEKMAGLAEVKNAANGTASFKYKPQQKLAQGFHLAKARITSSPGDTFSNEIVFEIRSTSVSKMFAPGLTKEQGAFLAPTPSPTLLEPKNGTVFKNQAKIAIQGVAHNNHYVKLFLDNNLVTEFMPPEDKSGVASFTYTLTQKLKPGLHKIWSTNLNSQDQESGISNIIKIIILDDQPIFVSKPQGQINGTAAINEVILTGEQKNNAIDLATQKDSKNNFWYYVLGVIIIILAANVAMWLFSKNKNQDKKDNSPSE